MNKKRYFWCIMAGVFMVILCMVLVPDTIKIDSENEGVKFIYDGKSVTDVYVDGTFLYGMVTSYPSDEIIRDLEGNVIEKIQTYDMTAAFSIRKRMDLKVHIESSDDIKYTYIFKFADKDITITNGKVLES